MIHASSGRVSGADTGRRPIGGLLARVAWVAVFVLVFVGVASALGRGVFLGDFGARLEPFRQQVLRVFDREDSLVARRAAELARFDRRFATHRRVTQLHLLPGAVFLLMAPLQFSSRIRRRHIGFHRRSGRILVMAAWLSGLAGLYFGLLMPYAGPVEAATIALFGGLFLTAVTIAFISIRRRQVPRHREWMIRAFALAIAVSTVRLVGPLLDIALTPVGVGPQAVFLLSLWLGWGLTIGAAEWWIARTRPQQ